MLRPSPPRRDPVLSLPVGLPIGLFVSFLILLAFAGILGPAKLLAAEDTLPRLVQFQGQIPLREAASLAQPVGITFAIYGSQSDESPEWLETQNVNVDADGRFSVQLGSTAPEGLPQELFTSNAARWLGVRVNQPDAAESPRVLLMSVPYALKAGDAETLGGLPASAYQLSPDAVASRVRENGGLPGAAATDVLPSAAVTAGKIAKFNSAVVTDIVDSVITESAGKIGIGTTPTYPLDVLSSSYTQARFRGATGNNAEVIIDSGSDNRQAALWLNSVGVNKWVIGKQDTSHTLFIWDGNNSKDVLRVDASGNMNIQPVSGTTYLNPSGGNVGIGTTSPSKKLDVAGDVTVAANGTFIGPPGMLLTHANFGTALGYDQGTATMLAGDGSMEAQTGTTSSSYDDTVGGVIDVTNLSKTSTIGDGLNRVGAFVSARVRWNGTINTTHHAFYVLAGGAGTSGALSSGGVKYGFGFKGDGGTLKGFTINGGSENVVTLSSCTPCTLSSGTWVDLLAVRRASTVEFYVNGVSRGSTGTSLPSSAGSTYEVKTQNGSSGTNAILQVAYLTTGMPY